MRVVGEQLSHRSPAIAARLRAQHIGVLTQASGLLGHLTVRDNIRFAASIRGGDGPSATDLLEGLLLTRVATSLPRTLSGGETARAGLAVALSGSPQILLADEPTAEVSADEERTVLELLQQLRPQNAATVLVTHSAAVAGYADRVVNLRDGRVA